MKSLFIALVGLLFVSNVVLANTSADEKLKKLLVIALVGDYNTRKVVEDEITFQLADAGITTSTSYNTSLRKELTKEKVIEHCKEVGADGVLFVHITDSKDPVEYQNKGNTNVHVYVWGGYIYGPGPYTPGASKKVKVKADVLRVEDGNQLYGGSQTLHVGLDPEPAIGKYAFKLTKALSRISKIEKN